eukprot:Opistho-1_new@102857
MSICASSASRARQSCARTSPRTITRECIFLPAVLLSCSVLDELVTCLGERAVCPPCLRTHAPYCPGARRPQRTLLIRLVSPSVIAGNSMPVFDEDWSATEESALLDAIEMYGFGNWPDIAEHVKTKVSDGRLRAHLAQRT